jgi:hypothetical protein
MRVTGRQRALACAAFGETTRAWQAWTSGNRCRFRRKNSMFFRGRSRNAKAADLAWTRDLLFAKGIRTQIKITMKIRITITIKIKTGVTQKLNLFLQTFNDTRCQGLLCVVGITT